MGPRLTAALAAILFLSSAAYAGVAEELIAAINNCAAIAEDATRHACYDRLPTLLKQLPAPAAEAPSPGGSNLFGGEPIPADHITATVESLTYAQGVFVVALDNGQVWRQIAAGDLDHFSREKKDRVTIWRGAFGHVLKIEGFHTTYRVRRVK